MSFTDSQGWTWRTILIIGATVVIGLVSSVWGLNQSLLSQMSEENRALILNHREDAQKHMAMVRQIDLFVLRKEYEQDIRDIKEDLQRVLQKLDEVR